MSWAPASPSEIILMSVTGTLFSPPDLDGSVLIWFPWPGDLHSRELPQTGSFLLTWIWRDLFSRASDKCHSNSSHRATLELVLFTLVNQHYSSAWRRVTSFPAVLGSPPLWLLLLHSKLMREPGILPISKTWAWPQIRLPREQKQQVKGTATQPQLHGHPILIFFLELPRALLEAEALVLAQEGDVWGTTPWWTGVLESLFHRGFF